MRGVFQGTEEDSFVGSVFPSREVGVVLDYLPEYFGREGLLLCLHESVLLLLRISFVVELPPLARFFIEHLVARGEVLGLFFLYHNSYKIMDWWDGL